MAPATALWGRGKSAAFGPPGVMETCSPERESQPRFLRGLSPRPGPLIIAPRAPSGSLGPDPVQGTPRSSPQTGMGRPLHKELSEPWLVGKLFPQARAAFQGAILSNQLWICSILLGWCLPRDQGRVCQGCEALPVRGRGCRAPSRRGPVSQTGWWPRGPGFPRDRVAFSGEPSCLPIRDATLTSRRVRGMSGVFTAGPEGVPRFCWGVWRKTALTAPHPRLSAWPGSVGQKRRGREPTIRGHP